MILKERTGSNDSLKSEKFISCRRIKIFVIS
jgi:hypothetical protein